MSATHKKKLTKTVFKRVGQRVWVRGLLIAVGLVGLGLLLTIVWAYNRYQSAALPGVSIVGMGVSGMSEAEIVSQLTQAGTRYQQTWPMTLKHGTTSFVIEFDPAVFSLDYETTARVAMQQGRSGHLRERLNQWWQLWAEGTDLTLTARADPDWLSSVTASMAAGVNVAMIPPGLELTETATGAAVIARPGEAGLQLDSNRLSADFHEALENLAPVPEALPVEVVEVAVDSDQLNQAQARGSRLIGKRLELKQEDLFEPKNWELTDQEMLSWVGFDRPYQREAVETYLESVAEGVNRPAQDARFSFNTESGRVEEFLPAKPGIELDTQLTATRIVQALEQLEQAQSVDPVVLAVSTVEPETALGDVNDLGITTLLGRGESTYYGSIASRVHNVGLAAQRITGYLVKPNETFSFNAAVGDISAATGYQAAYVIMNGRTELGDGGGVCQDSTTVFRAALDAGLPIVERRAHSYRVGYYEQNAKAGMDATVFSPLLILGF
jgi:vancomycin resistance protein YoaR